MIRRTRENRTTHTLYFRDQQCSAAKPGQFVMVWAPGYDEMPMSLSSYGKTGLSSITVKPWGPGTNDLIRMKPGGNIGVRGPYGVSYTVEKCNALLIGGGTGLAPLMPLAKELVDVSAKVIMIIGGKSKSEILFERRARRTLKGENLRVTTDDGTAGTKGFPTDIAEEIVVRKSIERIYTCGPEIMMRKAYDVAVKHGIEFEASLERGMKCGFGICGSCTIGPYLLCRDGPVLKRNVLTTVSDEFGLLQRDHSGRYMKV